MSEPRFVLKEMRRNEIKRVVPSGRLHLANLLKAVLQLVKGKGQGFLWS